MTHDFQGRLVALADVHSAVIRAGGEVVELGAIIETTFAPYGGPGGRVATSRPPLRLAVKRGRPWRSSSTSSRRTRLNMVRSPPTKGRSVSSGRSAPTTSSFSSSGYEPAVRNYSPSRVGYGTRYIKAAIAGLLGREPDIEYRPRRSVSHRFQDRWAQDLLDRDHDFPATPATSDLLRRGQCPACDGPADDDRGRQGRVCSRVRPLASTKCRRPLPKPSSILR